MMLSWKPAAESWITINTDGSVHNPGSMAAAGGIARNQSGRNLGCFMSNYGQCPIMMAELRGALEGLILARRLKASRVELQLDSLAAVQVLQNQVEEGHRHAPIIRQIQSLMDTFGEIKITHIYRE
ncbi:unnamed protein product [Linum trigynum]|uniref:RNase H type-1 domain-containing protein n=1 Tax=Linum trigynum TaxID=586398 RepID=A0AAV2GV54_9ROSI